MIKAINRSRTLRFTAIGMLSVGFVLVLSFASLYLTGLISESHLDDLNAELVDQSGLPIRAVESNSTFSTTSAAILNTVTKKVKVSQEIEGNTSNSLTQNNSSKSKMESQNLFGDFPIQHNNFADVNSSTKELISNSTQSIGSLNNMIAGYSSPKLVKNIHPKDWASPIWAESDVFIPYQTKGFLNEQNSELLTGPALYMRIPIIKVDSTIENLSIVEKNGRKSYETPKNVVGRIATDEKFKKSVPGWFFGHLESPIKGEGNVFHNLPEVAKHLRNGDPVYVHITNEEREFIYQANKSQVVHKSELQLYDLGVDFIMLVTCANRPYYDHRQLVTAHLIDIR